MNSGSSGTDSRVTVITPISGTGPAGAEATSPLQLKRHMATPTEPRKYATTLRPSPHKAIPFEFVLRWETESLLSCVSSATGIANGATQLASLLIEFVYVMGYLSS